MMEMVGVTLKLEQIGSQLILLSGVIQMVIGTVTTLSGQIQIHAQTKQDFLTKGVS